MKKEVKLILRTYREILQDQSVYAGLSKEGSSRNLSQIATLVNTRGLRVVYQDFPSAAKLVDRSLSDGYVCLSTLRLSLGRLPKSNLPRLFHELFVKLYDEDGNVVSEPDPTIVQYIRQLLLMFKKIVRDCEVEVTNQALEDFKRLDSTVQEGSFPVWKDPLDTSYPRVQYVTTKGTYEDPNILKAGNSVEEQTMRIAKHFGNTVDCNDRISLERSMASVFRYISTSFPLLTLDDLMPSHGSGATSDARWGDRYDFASWSNRLETIFPFCEFGMVNYSSYDFLEDYRNGKLQLSDRDYPVKIIAVPKTLKGPRIIGTESTSRMYCQQAVRGFLTRNLVRVTCGSVDIQNQAMSQAAALKGSIDGSLATIDLSSASDLLSCTLVEEVFASNPSILQALSACRALEYTIDLEVPFKGAKKKKCIKGKMRKFSHQGSAVTFPVQSLCYYAICVAVWHHERKLTVTPRTFKEASQYITVYGDDIIVPTEIYEPVTKALQLWGLKVNVDKSHGATVPGSIFRESCGIDAYNGVDVSPVYIRDLDYEVQKPETVVRFVEVGNNLHKAGYWNTSCGLFSPDGLKIPITKSEQASLAMHTFCKGVYAPGIVRYNTILHRYETKALVPTTVGSKISRDGYESILQYILEDPNQMPDWASGFYPNRPKVGLRTKWIQIG